MFREIKKCMRVCNVSYGRVRGEEEEEEEGKWCMYDIYYVMFGSA